MLDSSEKLIKAPKKQKKTRNAKYDKMKKLNECLIYQNAVMKMVSEVENYANAKLKPQLLLLSTFYILNII